MNEHEQLISFYASLTDEELIKIGSQFEALTSDAQIVLREEFDRRSLDAPELEEPPDAFEFQELITIRTFRDPSDAIMAKSVLDSAEVPCFLKDENTVRIQWVWSNLIGGIRLQVRPADVEIAEQLLSQEVAPTIELEDGKVYEQPRCPYCTSLDIRFEAQTRTFVWHPFWVWHRFWLVFQLLSRRIAGRVVRVEESGMIPLLKASPQIQNSRDHTIPFPSKMVGRP